MMESVSCNLCGAHDTVALISAGAFPIVRCRQCGLVYANPRPTSEKIEEHISADGNIAEHQRQVWHEAKIALFKSNFKKLQAYYRGNGRKLLDCGCGYGTFLQMAKDQGWEVFGVELSQAAYSYARNTMGFNVFPGTLKEACLQDESFDIVSSWEVLSELTDPLSELREIKRVLKRQGVLALRLHNASFHVPVARFLNSCAGLRDALRIAPTVFLLYNFSPKTIRSMLKKAGFADIRIEVSEFTAGDPYATGGVLGALGVSIIKKVVYYCCQCIYLLSFGSLVLSPSMVIFARKIS